MLLLPACAAAVPDDGASEVVWERPRACPDLPLGEPLHSFFLTPDGTSCLVARVGEAGDADLYYASRALGSWLAPVALDTVNAHPARDLAPTVSMATRTLIFSSDREEGHGGLDLWQSTWKDGYWSPPRNLGSVVNSPLDEMTAAVSPDGQLLVFGRAGEDGAAFRLHVSRRDGPSGWGEARPVEALGGTGSSLWPAFSADGGALYFSSDRSGGRGGHDLWICAVDEGRFGAARNLGSEVNTEGEEIAPSVSAEGYVLHLLAADRPGAARRAFRTRSHEILTVERTGRFVALRRTLDRVPVEWYLFVSLVVTCAGIYFILLKLNRENLLRRCMVLAIVGHLVAWRLMALILLDIPGENVAQPGPSHTILRGIEFRTAGASEESKDGRREDLPWEEAAAMPELAASDAPVADPAPVERATPEPAEPDALAQAAPPAMRHAALMTMPAEPVRIFDFAESLPVEAIAMPRPMDRDDTPRALRSARPDAAEPPVVTRAIAGLPPAPTYEWDDPARSISVTPAPELPIAVRGRQSNRTPAELSSETPSGGAPGTGPSTLSLVSPGLSAEKAGVTPGGSPAPSGIKGPAGKAAPPGGARGVFTLRGGKYRSAAAAAGGGGKDTEEAVEKALAWLALRQEKDGHWNTEAQGGRGGHDIGITGLAALAFLGAGYTDAEGPYRKQVSSALEWLIGTQKEDGGFGDPRREQYGGYYQAIATLALAEAYGMTRNDTYREAAQKGVHFAVDIHQKPGSGWRYHPGEDPDTSVTGWFIMALRSADLAGLEVKEKALRGADSWLDRAGTKDGWYGYTGPGSGRYRLTAVGGYSRILLGHDRAEDGVRLAADHLITHLPDWKAEKDFYYWYCGTLLMFQMGSETDYWRRWNDRLKPALVSNQESSGEHAGSWNPEGSPYGSRGGRVYTTALAAMCLEVYYRYLPLYK